MVVQKIKDIDPKKIKMAKHVLAVFELLGISEDNLSSIKEIRNLEEKYDLFLKMVNDKFKIIEDNQKEIMNTLKNVGQGGTVKKAPIDERIYNAYGKKVEEFDPNGGRK